MRDHGPASGSILWRENSWAFDVFEFAVPFDYFLDGGKGSGGLIADSGTSNLHNYHPCRNACRWPSSQEDARAEVCNADPRTLGF